MKTKNWFQKETVSRKRPALVGQPLPARSGHTSEAAKFASRLRPAELMAMLTHHYARVRARSLPKVKTSLSVVNTRGKQAVTISFG